MPKNKFNKSFMFNENIPTGIFNNKIKVDPETMDNILMRKCKAEKIPNNKEIEIMAKHSPFLKYVDDVDKNTIKADRENIDLLIENNKSKKSTDLNSGLLINSSVVKNHVDFSQDELDKIEMKTAKKLKTKLVDNKMSSNQFKFSEKSRELIEEDKIKKATKNSKKKYSYERTASVKGVDIDPITKISKNVRSISENVYSKNELYDVKEIPSLTKEEINHKANMISTAVNIMKNHNSKKINAFNEIFDSAEDNEINNLNNKISNIKDKSKDRISKYASLEEISFSDNDIKNIYNDIMSKKYSKSFVNKNLNDLKEENKKQNDIRSDKIKRTSSLENESDLSYNDIVDKKNKIEKYSFSNKLIERMPTKKINELLKNMKKNS